MPVDIKAGIESSARCFRRLRDDGDEGKRCGLWVMTRESGRRGAFFHGDREEIQAPRYTVEELGEWAAKGGFLPVEELAPREALEELDSWPEGRDQLRKILERHPK
jgi:hypothetical protein